MNKVLKSIVNAPWYAPNKAIKNDLKVPSVKGNNQKGFEGKNIKLSSHDSHDNVLARKLTEN